MTWEMLTADDDEEGKDGPTMPSLLPSSLMGEWTESPQGLFGAVPQVRPAFHTANIGPTNAGLTFPKSAPLENPPFEAEDITFQGEIEQDEWSRATTYYSVKFNAYRSAVFHANSKVKYNVGDYVLTEADRGLDIGRVTSILEHPTRRDMKSAKMIMRAATTPEVMQLPEKAEREARAMAICQARANDLGLPMNITRAEFQFDGKKLTFYYTAATYIDFRGLVRTLFKMFGTRIWMVWYDGKSDHLDARPGGFY